MASITLRILDGADRGRVFENIEAPITLGREEGNVIQLNDERVSRFHAKIQVDHDDFVLTDLDSTNGTKVNGELAQLKILRHGDMISLGRSTLLFGSREDIVRRLQTIQDPESMSLRTDSSVIRNVGQLNKLQENTDLQLELLEGLPPELPQRLSPGQAAKLSEILEYFHLKVRRIVRAGKLSDSVEHVIINQRQWQNLLDVHARIAEYLRMIARPEDE